MSVQKDLTALLHDMPWFKLHEITPQQRARVIEHPVEDGSVVQDTKVVEPLKVHVRGYVKKKDFEAVDASLAGFLADHRDVKWKITTRFTIYYNLVLTSMNHREKPDMLDVAEYTLEFTQMMLTKSSTSVSDPSNAPSRSV